MCGDVELVLDGKATLAKGDLDSRRGSSTGGPPAGELHQFDRHQGGRSTVSSVRNAVVPAPPGVMVALHTASRSSPSENGQLESSRPGVRYPQ